MSAHTEVPGVNTAVERLLELADRMRDEDFGFSNKDIGNIDRVIEAINQLDEERKKIHEKLETETIHASILRHKLQFLPGDIKSEIKAAVNSARESNAVAHNKMKSQLETIVSDIKQFEEQQLELDKENATLHPEREIIRQKHEEIISQLNERMAEKANMQIILNETRDKVRQTNQNIVDLEDGILQLKEDLIQERTEARVEKKKLKRAVTDTSDMTKEQKEVNVGKKVELDDLHEKMVDSEGKLEAIRKSLRRYETSKTKLEGQERQLNSQLGKQLKQNEELRRKGAAIINEDLKLEKEFEDNEKQLQKKVKRLESEISKETAKNADLTGRKLELRIDLEEKMRIRADDAIRVKELDNELQAEKRLLTLRAEEMGRMQTENVQMQEQIESLAESHKEEATVIPDSTVESLDDDKPEAVIAQLNKQIESYREQLSKERKERLDVQERKNSVQKDVEDYKVESQKFLFEMNKKIKEGKSRHIELTNEGTQLQTELRTEEQEIKKLDDSLKHAQKQYTDMYNSMQKKIDVMEEDIIKMEAAIEEKKKLIEDRTPVFLDLEKVFEERTNAYNEQKRNIAKMRQKKSGLEENIKKAQGEKAKIVGPREYFKENLKKKRDETIFQLKRHGEERQKIEQDIFLAGCKIRTVMEENQKLDDGGSKLKEEIQDLELQMEENTKVKQRLEEELDHVKDDLVKSWQNDQEINDFFITKDQEVVEGFSQLLHKTEEREQKINQITKRLNEELVYLAAFLENLATRRPQSTPPPPELRRPKSKDGRHSQMSQKGKKEIGYDIPSKPPSQRSMRPSTRGDNTRPSTRGDNTRPSTRGDNTTRPSTRGDTSRPSTRGDVTFAKTVTINEGDEFREVDIELPEL